MIEASDSNNNINHTTNKASISVSCSFSIGTVEGQPVRKTHRILIQTCFHHCRVDEIILIDNWPPRMSFSFVSIGARLLGNEDRATRSVASRFSCHQQGQWVGAAATVDRLQVWWLQRQQMQQQALITSLTSIWRGSGEQQSIDHWSHTLAIRLVY